MENTARARRHGARAVAAAALVPLLVAGPAAALDLGEAMRLAREQAREVAAARARTAAGEARLERARGFRLPSVSLHEIGIRTDSPAEAFALTLNQERFSFADFVAGDPNDPDVVESFTSRLELSLPLYTGGESAARIRQARSALAADQAGEAWTADQAALAAATAYVRLAQAREGVVLVERALSTVEAHVALARAYVEEGLLVRSELLRADVERARLEDQLLEARGLARVAEANLSFALGLPLDESWSLEPLPASAELAEPLGGFLASLGSRGDLEAARSLVGAAEEEIAARQAARLPKVGLVARADLVDDSLFGTHGESTAVMAVASFDLWAGGRHRAAVAAARAEADAAARDVERFTEGTALAVRRAYEIASTSRERHATALAALAAAREAERITGERFAQGVVKTIDVLDAETALREAETRELVARAEAVLSTIALAVEAGRAPETALPAPTAAGGQ